MTFDLEKELCQDHAHCASCGQYLLGWDAYKDVGAWFCNADCWLEYREQLDPPEV